MSEFQPLKWRPAPGGPKEVVAGRRSFSVFDPETAACRSDLVVWDSWPALDERGFVWRGPDGLERWFALAAPRRVDQEMRHVEARIHQFALDGETLLPLGEVFIAGATPGSREWSGTATVVGDRLTMRFTAAGHRGEAAPSAAQRLFEATTCLVGGEITDWSQPQEIVIADGNHYQRVDGGAMVPGMVKGFRDPDLFDEQWLLFTASSASAPSEHDGVIGLAFVGQGGSQLLPPIVDGCGVNRELERPHLRRFGDLLYLFWCTHAGSFSSDYRGWPTGLYGAVAPSIEGPWSLLNGDGLVAANPADRMTQAYGWMVLPDRRVTGFADRPGGGAAPAFCGAWAPVEMLLVDGNRAVLD